MRVVNTVPELDESKCIGCVICSSVCPTLAWSVDRKTRLAVLDEPRCFGCLNCEARCPTYAITMVPRREDRILYVDPGQVSYAEIESLCRRARFHPEQIICFCTSSRAEEVAAAILTDSRTAEEISARTGVRSGCTIECAQPILRMLEAAGIAHRQALDGKGWQLYGRVPTAWEIPESVKKKYADRGFHFEEDIALMEEVVAAPAESSDRRRRGAPRDAASGPLSEPSAPSAERPAPKRILEEGQSDEA